MPDLKGNDGDSRSLAGTPAQPLTWRRAGQDGAGDDLRSSSSAVLWSWCLGLTAARLILLDNPHSAFGQDPSQLNQMRLAQAQHVRIPADAHSHRCSPDTAAPITDFVLCAG